jgi:hypothetical protein
MKSLFADRSNWGIALGLALAWSSAGSGQEPRLQPVPQSGGGERTMTVQEQGKPASKCRILQEWRQPSGAVAYKVQVLDTAEFLTIAENSQNESVTVPMPGSPTPTVVKTMATQIYHWGNSTTSPAGAPVPPAAVVPAAAVSPAQVNPPMASSVCQTGDCQSCQEITSAPSPRPLFPRLRQALTSRDTVTDNSSVSTIKSGPATETVMQVSATAPPPVTSVSPAVTAPAEASDWRKSWGQPREQKTEPTAVPVDSDPSKKTAGSPPPPASVTETQTGLDPLFNADRLAGRAQGKLTSEKPGDYHPLDRQSSLTGPGSPPPQVKMPLGVQSVLAAGAAPGQVQYLPVPVVTVPPVRPPSTPSPLLPQPPPAPTFTNAFTPPMSGNPNYGPGSTYALGQRPPYPGPSGPPSAMPMQHPPIVPVVYQGPTPPPNPFGGMPVVPDGSAPVSAVNTAMDRRGPATPAATASQPASAETLKQLTAMLRDSLYPSQRQLAAMGLTDYDWHYYPQAMQALVTAAREDPAPVVRAVCVTCLTRMNARCEPVYQALAKLRNDPDPGVRHEVEQAVVRLH